MNLSIAEDGDFGKESDSNQEPQDVWESLAQSSMDLLSCFYLAQMVNKLAPLSLVPIGPSCYLVMDRPKLTGHLSTQ